MLKGVNKHVVEVVDFDNEYFERAILFVKAGKQGKGEESLKESARRYLGSIRYRPRSAGSWKRWLLITLFWAATLAAGVALAAFLLK